MTSIRQSFCFALESKFGKGKPKDDKWTCPPPGSYLQTTAQRDATRVNTSGRKFADAFAYNRFTGKWDWNFTLDYNYLEPLLLIFDSYECKRLERAKNTGTTWSASSGTTTDSTKEYIYEHTFKMRNSNRAPSFCIRRVIDHGVAGNYDEYPDEIGIIKGCVAQSLRMSQAAGSSMMQCSMTGFYVNEEIHRVAVNGTDFEEYDNKDGLIEYFCMFMDEFKDEYYVANTESIGLDIAQSVSPTTNSCGPIGRQFNQGNPQFNFSTSCYANDPKRYKERMMRGGKSSGTKGTAGSTYQSQFYERNVEKEKVEAGDGYKSGSAYNSEIFDTNLATTGAGKATKGYMLSPLCKGAAPLDDAYMVSYNLCREYDSQDDEKGSLLTAINKSTKMFKIHLTDVTMTSATWQKGENSKLYDQLSSTECGSAEITVRNSTSALCDTSSVRKTATKFKMHDVTTLAEELTS